MTENEIRADYRKITEKLIEKGKTITTMESCTSGLLKGAFVTYSNIGKIMQGVPEETIEKYSVYSNETAIAMAEACRKTYNADYGIGVTGTMGNVDPANASASVPGRVYFAIAKENKTEVFYRELSPKPSRYEYKLAVAEEISKELLERI